MECIAGKCAKWTGVDDDDKFFEKLLQTMVSSGYLKGDLTSALRLAGITGTASLHITKINLEDSDADQVKINSKEFYIEGLHMEGKLIYNGDNYEVEMTVDISKSISYTVEDLQVTIRDVATEPELFDGIKDMITVVLGDVFKEKIEEEVEETKIKLDEEGKLTDSETGSESAEYAGAKHAGFSIGLIALVAVLVIIGIGVCIYLFAFSKNEPTAPTESTTPIATGNMVTTTLAATGNIVTAATRNIVT